MHPGMTRLAPLLLGADREAAEEVLAREHRIGLHDPGSACEGASLLDRDGQRRFYEGVMANGAATNDTVDALQAQGLPQMIRVLNSARKNNRLYVRLVSRDGGNVFSGSLRDTLVNDKWRTLTPFEKTTIDRSTTAPCPPSPRRTCAPGIRRHAGTCSRRRRSAHGSGSGSTKA